MGASDETTNFLPLSLDPSSPLCSGRVVSHHLCGHLASTGGSVWKRSDMPRRPALPRSAAQRPCPQGTPPTPACTPALHHRAAQPTTWPTSLKMTRGGCWESCSAGLTVLLHVLPKKWR